MASVIRLNSALCRSGTANRREECACGATGLTDRHVMTHNKRLAQCVLCQAAVCGNDYCTEILDGIAHAEAVAANEVAQYLVDANCAPPPEPLASCKQCWFMVRRAGCLIQETPCCNKFGAFAGGRLPPPGEPPQQVHLIAPQILTDEGIPVLFICTGDKCKNQYEFGLLRCSACHGSRRAGGGVYICNGCEPAFAPAPPTTKALTQYFPATKRRASSPVSTTPPPHKKARGVQPRRKKRRRSACRMHLRSQKRGRRSVLV